MPSTITAGLFYLHRDYQGSILMITDAAGAIREKRQFDAWGNIVKLTDGSGVNLSAFIILDRGYTGHEHLLGVGLIHMNGRLYDPLLHRFLGPDNFIQDPSNSQSYNRFAYVFNNPLKYTDPNGEFIPVLVFVGAAIIGATVNVAGNWDKIKKNPWSAIGYALSGGVGGAVSVVYPTAGFAIAAGGNAATDIVSGNMPKFKNGWDVAKYAGITALNSTGVSGAGSLAKVGYKIFLSLGWIQTVSVNTTAAGTLAATVNATKVATPVAEKIVKNVVTKGISVIGSRATYREFAKKIGANFLNVTDEAWSMRKNVKFLQEVVKRGDDVIFAGKYNPLLLDTKSVLAQEIRYLIRHGYSWTDDFSMLIIK